MGWSTSRLASPNVAGILSDSSRQASCAVWECLLFLFWVYFGISRCWMKDNDTALLAHYFTNLALLVVLVLSGLVMLFLVYRQIRTREEWRQNRVAFLSIWGLSCLFGTTWGLAFLSFGPLSVFFVFLFCFLNSFQGEYCWNIMIDFLITIKWHQTVHRIHSV